MPRIPISELQKLSHEEKLKRIRERVIEMYEELGDLEDAIKWMWDDVDHNQRGEDK